MGSNEEDNAVLQDPNGAPHVLRLPRILAGLPVYFLFECAFGYVLFLCHNVDKEGHSFESTEEYTKHYKEVFNFVAYYPFQSTAAALHQLTAYTIKFVVFYVVCVLTFMSSSTKSLQN